MNRTFLLLSILVAGGLLLSACDADTNTLAPYEGERPLILMKITQSYAPDIQWVGGRVAAVGVNSGPVAAFDSTLVWLKFADGDEINSHATIGEGTDVQRIVAAGGTPLDSLQNSQQYTFWLATRAALDAALDTTRLDEFSFFDTTFTLGYQLRGNLRTRENVSVAAFRDQKLVSDRIVVRWEPANFAFRRVALRAASSPGWENLVWHIQTPDGQPSAIRSPVSTSDSLGNVVVIEQWPEAGIAAGVSYTLWMTADNWNNTFTLTSPGLAYIQIFSSSIRP